MQREAGHRTQEHREVSVMTELLQGWSGPVSPLKEESGNQINA